MIRRFLTVILIYSLIGAASPYLSSAHPGARENIQQSLPTEAQIKVQGQLISLDVRDADLSDILRVISQKANIDLTLGEGVSGRVSIKLTDVTLEEALKNLCRSRALVYEYLPDKKAYRIIHAMAFTESDEQERLSKAATAAGVLGGSKAAASGSAGQQEKEIAAAAPGAKAGGQPGGGDSNGSGAAGNQIRPLYKPRELLVNFKPGITEQQMADLHRLLGSTVLRSSKNRSLQRIKLREGLAEEEALGLYGASEIVEYVERHALRYPLIAPNDQDFPEQWGLVKIKAPEAWDITRGSQEVIVAVIDTGVDYSHPDLKDNIWINEAELNGLPGVDDDGNGYVDDIRGWDFAGNDNDPLDVYIHGAHVAGIVAARGNNSLGIAGLNWQLKIMPLKAMADNGTSFDDDAVSDAIDYAIAKGAKIVTCSFGGLASSLTEKNAFTRLRNAGILAVCAAGNGDDLYIGMDTDLTGQQHYPSGLDLANIISVAASDENDNLATFSNYGRTSVDVMAPGVDIYSTVPGEGETAAFVRTGGALPVEYTADGMLFAGPTGENGLTATLYDCGKGYPDEFPTAVRGNIALIERGNRDGIPFNFSDKVRNAQAAGAVGAIVYNNVAEYFSGTLGSPGNWVPVVSLTQADGAALKTLGTPLVTLINKPLGAYDFLSGPSMAAPHVAGLAGLMLAQCPGLGYGEIKAAILDKVDKIPAVANQMVSGGRINALAALTSLQLPGDLSGNCQVGLDDAVLALRILSGLPAPAPDPCPSCPKDVNGDHEIGLPEALFILQKTAEMR